MIGRVRELNTFFSGKLQIVQNKMKLLIDGVELFIPPILNKDKIVKEWQGWADSFDKNLDHPKFLAFCQDEKVVANVYGIIDILYKIDLDMKRFILESKAIIEAKWAKCVDELKGIKDSMWPKIDIDIEIWEAVAGIKTLPSGDSD